MANGFSKSITSPVNIPQVQPIQPTQSDTGDAIQLASFGLSLYEREKAKQSEASRQLKLQELTGKSQEIATDLLSALDQKDLTSVQQAVRVNRAINAASTSPTEREFLMGKVGEILKTDLFAGAIEAEKSASDLMTEEILSYEDFMQGVVLGGKNLDQMTDEQKRDALDGLRALSVKRESARIANEKLGTNPSVPAYADALDSIFSLEYASNEHLLGSLIQQVTAAGGDPASIELLSQARLGLSRQFSQQENIARDLYNQAMKQPSLSPSDRTAITAIRDNALKQMQDMRSRLESMDEEQFQNAAKMANLLKTQMQVELQESAPEIFKLKEIAGSGYNALMSTLLNRLPNFKAGAIATLEKGATAAFLSSTEGRAVIAQTFDLKEMNLMLEGKSISQYDQDKADALAGQRWTMVAPLIEDPKMLDSLPEQRVENLTLAMIEVLDRADEVGDKESLKNANKLLSSPAVESLIARSKDENTQRVLSNYVASSTAALLQDQLQRAGISYNANSQKFETGGAADPGAQEISKLSDPRAAAGAVERKAAAQERKNRVKTMNNKLEQSAKLLVKYNPAIDDIKEARDYLLIGAAPNKVKGTLNPFQPNKVEAIQAAVKLEEIEKSLELKKRVQEFEAGVREANVQVGAALGAEIKPQQAADTSDMDDEEFEEMIKQMRDARAKR